MPGTIIRCPECGHQVREFFDHIAIECEHDMTETKIAELLRQEKLSAGLREWNAWAIGANG